MKKKILIVGIGIAMSIGLVGCQYTAKNFGGSTTINLLKEQCL